MKQFKLQKLVSQIKNFFLISFLIPIVFSISCSTQNRSAESNVDEYELFDLLNASSVGGNGGSFFRDLAIDDNESILFFAEAPSSMGSVVNLFSTVDLRIFGGRQAEGEVSHFRVFFVDSIDQQGRMFALRTQITVDGESFEKHYVSDVSNYESSWMEDGEYVIELVSGGSRLRLRSFDVYDNEEFRGTIQLRAYEINSDGSESLVAKFSTLAGFISE